MTSGGHVSKTLNAIEPLWKSLKREIPPEIYEDENHFREFLTETFLRLSLRLSFAIDWTDTFLPDAKSYADHSDERSWTYTDSVIMVNERSLSPAEEQTSDRFI